MKRALIVDDSKTAQIRLKKMLARYDLAVDLAYSAEEALGYLSYETPYVIFLDHSMEGMDGLEALKIIKATPNTATIHVVMYTAQKGDVYINKARSLGALDVLTKDHLRASGLEQVLSKLNVYPLNENEIMAKDSPSSSNENHLNSELTDKFERMLENHLADVRQEISDNSRKIVKNVIEEIETTLDKEPTVGDIPISVINAEISAEQRKSSVVSGSLLILIFLGLGIIAFELFQTKEKLGDLTNSYQELVNINRQEQKFVSNLTESMVPPPPKQDTINQNTLIETLSWAIDTDLQFDYNASPLDAKQVVKVSNLVYRLASAGFRGVVELNLNFGNVCLQNDETGNWRLAQEDIPVEDCTLLEDLSQEFSASEYLSVSYMNFEQTAAPVKNGVIEMQVSSNGLSTPRYEYPTLRRGITAGAWNAIALKNNRVSVRFNFL